MLTEIYISALLVNENLADQVWDAGKIADLDACLMWRWTAVTQMSEDRLN